MHRKCAFIALLGVLIHDPKSWADQLVEVARQRSVIWPARHETTPPLLGYLAIPSGPGPFPAVVLLHGCTGFDQHDTAATSFLQASGYLALALDSLGGANVCGANGAPGTQAEAQDAYLALRYLQSRDDVAPTRIAVLGYSMGGAAALLAVDKDQSKGTNGFRAMVAYYPPCAFSAGVLTAPALILIGDRDDWVTAPPCQRLAAHQSEIGISRSPATGTSIRLIVYPGVTHAFDYRLPPGRYNGHVIQYDDTATKDAENQVRSFLDLTLKLTSP